jgi:hypothetical protein
MSRSGVFYVIKAMEGVASGTSPAGAARASARPEVDREVPAAARPNSPSRVRRVLAAVYHGIAGAPGRAARGRRRLGGAAQAD